MAEQRPDIPAELKRQVLVEAGHRCAIPTCRQTTIEIHHIEPWAKVMEHRFENLIALCPTDHARASKGEIDRKSMRLYKHNLGIVTSRYGELEQRLLDMFAQDSMNHVLQAPRNMDFEFMYLIGDGLLERIEQQGGVWMSGVRQGPEIYALTAKGQGFVAQWRAGTALD